MTPTLWSWLWSAQLTSRGGGVRDVGVFAVEMCGVAVDKCWLLRRGVVYWCLLRQMLVIFDYNRRMQRYSGV